MNLHKDVHELLKAMGYEFFQITDLRLTDEKHICTVTVKALKTLPANLQHSCTGIDDPMITSFINKTGMDCDIFVEAFD